MTLAQYTPPSREVPLGDSTLRVEGLSLEHLAILVREHLPDLEALFEVFTNAGAKDVEDFKRIVFALVTQAPGFAANLIALAAGEPDGAPNAMRIPAPTQIEIILAIGDLTFKEVGGIKKATETIAGLLSAVNPKVEKLASTKIKKAR